MNWWKRRGRLLAAAQILSDAIERAAKGAKTIREIRRRLAIKAHAGDLDDAIRAVADAKQISLDYVENG